MPFEYPEKVEKLIDDILPIIEKHYPGLTKNKYNTFGQVDHDGSSARERLGMVVYVELIRAGVFNEENDHAPI